MIAEHFLVRVRSLAFWKRTPYGGIGLDIVGVPPLRAGQSLQELVSCRRYDRDDNGLRTA